MSIQNSHFSHVCTIAQNRDFRDVQFQQIIYRKEFLMFWENFNRLCIKKGTSPDAVAKVLSIPSGSVTDWKRGRKPRDATLLRIADYFGVTVSDLLDDPAPTDRMLRLPITERTISDEEYEIIVAMRRQTETIPFIRRLLSLPEAEKKKAES